MIRPLAFTAAIMVGVAVGEGVLAQSPTADACTGLATQSEEIACLRGALQESRAAQARATQTAPQTPVTPAPSVAPQRSTTPTTTTWDLGAEQVTASRKSVDVRPEPQRLRAVATAVSTNYLGLVTLQLDNGQIWQQAEGRGVPLRLKTDRTYPVEISPSGFGGYRMSFGDSGREIVVTRLQ